MNVDNLKPGTKLMWDTTPETDIRDNIVKHTVSIGSKSGKNKSLTWMQSSESIGHWISGEYKYLRLPTEEELQKLIWPQIKENQ